MWAELKDRLAGDLARVIRERFGVEHQPVLEVPPRRELGDLASPAAMQLARSLRRPPRAIAEELAGAFTPPDFVREVRVEGAGYLNFHLRRPAFAARLLAEPLLGAGASGGPGGAGMKVIVEHTNINPNKAAHIGHLRNAVLGDVLARVLRALARTVEVQNYIDDTGVQLADVVVGFVDLRGMGVAEVAALAEPFDYLCWDLYSEVGRWYEENRERQAARRETLHQLEIGQGPRAEMGRLVARRIVSRHLATMARLGVSYDLLTHESDILGLHFFERAFEQLKESGAVRLEKEGKNAGCWVMPLAESEEFAGLEDPDKVIVRSDGTVTYVGKDIAYQLWKFGLLGRDFEYRLWQEEGVWETTSQGGAPDHPPFGCAGRVINVIDNRQSYLQKIVRAGLEALGHREQAARSVHFAYEMVALSPDTARLLGFLDEGEERTLEMSGRKGIGVKADDLIDRLEAKSREEIATRNRDLPREALDGLARQIATAALRFFMVKATTNRVIAFDFDEALSFEGESGPYLQYSLVRAKNIRRRLREEDLTDAVEAAQVAALPEELFEEDLWDLILAVAQTGEVAERAAAGLELSLLARHALEAAQRFHAVYHRHPILQEKDEPLRTARLATVEVFRRGLEAMVDLLGVPVPEKM
jgi:arginyl-tRNA synthetase